MATQGTPFAGLTELATRCYIAGPQFSFVLYTNAADSLGLATVAADLVQPPLANGYSPIPLDGQWSIVNGVATYVHSDGGNPTWSATGTWGSNPVTGAAMVYGAAVVHFRDLSAAFIAAAGKKLSESISNLLGP